MKTQQPHPKNGLTSISEWFLNPTPEKVDRVPSLPAEASGNVVNGPLVLDGAASVAASKRDDDETAIIRTSTSEEPDEPTFLDWRMNPKNSLADWTVVITTPGRTSAKYYHIHRNIVMLPSRYFRKLFKKQRRTGGRSDFHLPEEAAEVFPEFLDYLYRLGHESFNRKNSVPLYYLSRIFTVERLRWETRKFWESDMTVATIAHYYQAAITFEEETLMTKVLQACVDEDILSRMDEDSAFLKNKNPRMMMYLATKADPKHSEHLSKLIAQYCVLHLGKVDSQIFSHLTRPLTAISLDAACTLLIHERGYYAKNTGITELQMLCIQTLAKNWAELDVTSKTFETMLGMQGHEFLAELFQQTTLAAQGRPVKVQESAPTESEAPESTEMDDSSDGEVVVPPPTVDLPTSINEPVDPIISTRTDEEAES